MHRKNRKKKNQRILLLILLLCLSCIGCRKKEEITLKSEETVLEPETDQIVHSAADENESETAETGSVCVYVCGAVNTPGVYELENGSRIFQAIAMAGGLTQEAASTYVNQAEPVTDGQKIYVPKMEEVSADGMMQGTDLKEGTATQQSEDEDKVNINTADQTELQTLPGIGEMKASAIIAYREANGAFSGTEEIMQVEGIKEGTFRKIKDLIYAQ